MDSAPLDLESQRRIEDLLRSLGPSRAKPLNRGRFNYPMSGEASAAQTRHENLRQGYPVGLPGEEPTIPGLAARSGQFAEPPKTSSGTIWGRILASLFAGQP